MSFVGDGMSQFFRQTNPQYSGLPQSPPISPNLGMPSPQIPQAANPPQNPGKYMQQAMQLSGVPGLMGNRPNVPQPGQGNATGYVPRNILQLLQQYGISGSFNGGGANLGMGMPFDFSGLFR